MTARDRREFQGYLGNCTNAQVMGVYEKEKAAGRRAYMNMAKAEAIKRGIWF